MPQIKKHNTSQHANTKTLNIIQNTKPASVASTSQHYNNPQIWLSNIMLKSSQYSYKSNLTILKILPSRTPKSIFNHQLYPPDPNRNPTNLKDRKDPPFMHIPPSINKTAQIKRHITQT